MTMLMLTKFAGTTTSSALLKMQRGRGFFSRIPSSPMVVSSSRTAPTSPDFWSSSNSSNQMTKTSKRSLSFYQQSSADYGKRGGGGGYGGGNAGGPLRAFPTYAVFGEACLLNVKLLPPTFRVHPNSNTLLLDASKKGRILLEWTPRVADGKLSREKESQLRFGLSAEEVGLMLDQLPANIVEFSRRAMPGAQQSEFGAITNTTTADVPDKVLRITPGEGGSVPFLIDHELNGVSVPPPSPTASVSNDYAVVSASSSSAMTGPLDVVVQLGEFVVIKELLRSSIPVLVGWNTMVEINMQRSFENMQNIHNNQGGGGGSGGGHPF